MPNSECSHSFSSCRNCFFSSRFVFAPPPVPALEIFSHLSIKDRDRSCCLYLTADSCTRCANRGQHLSGSPRVGSTVSIAPAKRMFLVAQRKTREGLSIEDGNLRSKSLS